MEKGISLFAVHKQAHTVYKTQYHIVWVTRYRRKILTIGIESYLKIKLEEVRKFYPDWHYVEVGSNKDHIYLHMIIPPKYSVGFVVETIKKNTSRALREKFAPFLKKVYWDNGGIWSKGFFVSTVGINEEIMIHQPLGGTEGQASDIAITAKQILKIKDKLNKILAKHSGQTVAQVEKDSDRDYFMSAEEAVKYGLVDGIVKTKTG